VAGYSGTPLPKKLGIGARSVKSAGTERQRVALFGAPSGFEALLQPLPDAVQLDIAARGKGPYDVILLFCSSLAQLLQRFAGAQQKLAPDGGLWVCWPKRASGIATDLTEDRVREHALAQGLVDNKVCAVDATWSGLRLVYRVKDRARLR
jgi:hypothetical protein